MSSKDNRTLRAKKAQDTLKILDQGGYYNNRNQWIDISDDIENCINNTKLYSPEELEEIKEKSTSSDSTENLQVTNESTLAAARRLWEKGYHPVCLNFASAKNPGGGFLKGSGAQEESLARASALYASISRQNKYYEINKKFGSALYTDYMIYSPQVPVFRDDYDQLLDTPFYTAIITAPAVNAGVVFKREPENECKVETTMINRIQKILCLAADREHDSIVLGAYGCGVFKNPPDQVAEYFKHCLWENFSLGYLFDQITFAILARKDKSNYNLFKSILENRSE